MPRSPQDDSLVLIVDSDRSTRDGIARWVRAAAHTAEAFASAAAFLARGLPHRPHCLILDDALHAPGGLDLQEHLLGESPSTPVVVLSASPDIRRSVRAMKLGAIDFLEKPVMRGPLLVAVDLALETSQGRREGEDERRQLLARFESLKPREREVLTHVVSGMRNKVVAHKMGITEGTVKIHRGRMMAKMQATSLPDLVLIHRQLVSATNAPQKNRR